MLTRPIRRAILGVAAAAGIGMAALVPAHASFIYPTSVTGSSSYTGYPDSDAIDTGASKLVTDWASLGQGAGTYLNMTFGAVEHFTSVFLTDRTTSGGGNGSFVGGLFDYTTRASLQAFDASFTTPIGAPVFLNKPVPGSTASVTDFQFSQALSGLDSRYLRYTVVATNGNNPGLADIEFTAAVPEPMTVSILGMALLGLGIVRHRKRV